MNEESQPLVEILPKVQPHSRQEIAKLASTLFRSLPNQSDLADDEITIYQYAEMDGNLEPGTARARLDRLVKEGLATKRRAKHNGASVTAYKIKNSPE